MCFGFLNFFSPFSKGKATFSCFKLMILLGYVCDFNWPILPVLQEEPS